jgi:LysM repeat protein
MNKISGIIILLFLSVNAFSQEEPVEVKRSTDKVILEGKVYYIHYVREKETLYAISKAYNIDEKVITLENPDVFAGLKAGMVLKIPADPVHIQEITIPETDEFHFHVISAGETLYFLSKKYNVSIEEIQKYNPEVEYSDLQVNQVIKIPKVQYQQPRDTFPTEDYFFHHVKKGETLYSLSIYYGVDEEQIRDLNPELKWGNIKYDEYIKIPRKTVLPETDTIIPVLDTIPMDTLFKVSDTILMKRWIDADCAYMTPNPLKRPIQVGLFLPLSLRTEEINDSIALQEAITKAEEDPGVDMKWEDINKLKEELSAINPRIIGFLDFYEGILLALDSLKKANVSIELYVYDTERDTLHFEQILNQKELKNMDLIFGPVETENLKLISDFGKEHKIPVISPFTDSQWLLRDNPYFIQMIPAMEIEFRNWAKFLTNFWGNTMIIIYDGDSTEYETIEFLKQEMYEELARKSFYDGLRLKEVVITDSAEYEMNQFLTEEDQNIIIIPSSNEAYVSNILTALFFEIEEYDIRVFGMSNWHKFQSIDLEYLHKMGINYFTTFYVDYKKEAVLKFVRKFREVYKTEPYRVSPRGYNLSMYGYDLMFYFTSMLSDYGKDFISCPVNPEYKPMLGPYLFRKSGEHGGFMNQFSIMIEYSKDLEIRQLIIDDSFYPTKDKDASFKNSN